ncbi:MAG: helix-turn-helix transcriptional regulator [Oscillospiraceae bacterium]|nr:helix-turn-helix transcriptional regulator [Oscillospiraceae bacterium]
MCSKQYQLRIRDLREDMDLNQTQVAEILNTSQRVYSRYETEERALPIQHLYTLAEFYNTSADYILGLTNVKEPYPRSKKRTVCR